MATELTVENQDNIYRVHTYPVRIGRAKDNDIIVKEPFVADYHAVIEQGAQGLTIRSLEQSHANGERIPTTRPLTNNTLLQIGTATLKLWLDSGKPMPLAHKQRRWWPLFTHPVAVTAWFLAAIFLTMWQGYLDSPQSYIVDYNRLITAVIILLGLTWITHSMIQPLARRYLILPVLGLISAYSTVSDLLTAAADWYSFQFNSTGAGTWATILGFAGFLALYRAFLRDHIPLAGRILWRATALTLLPTLLLVTYGYLRDHDFYSQRPGSYPVYPNKLQNSVLLDSQIKPIKNFFSIDKNE